MSITPETLSEVADFLKASLLEGEDAFVISVAGIAPNIDCELPMIRVGIEATVNGSTEQFTGRAIDLDNATRIARMKLRDRRDSIAREREKARKERKEARS